MADTIPSHTWTRAIRRERRFDVVVVGAGAAGVAAAVSAASAGANTLLVERYPVLGGTTTYSGVSSFQIGPDVHGAPIIQGHYANVMRRLHERGVLNGRSFSGEVLKVIYLEMCEEAGVNLLLHGYFTDAEVTDGRISRIAVETRSGLETVAADVFIDATADGDLGVASGAPVATGRPKDGQMQPLTLYLTLRNVDFDTVRQHDPADFYPIFERVLPHVRTSQVRLSYGPRFSVTLDGRLSFSMMHIRGVNGADADELTQAEITARHHAHDIWRFFREHVPGCEQSVLESTPFQIGIRETRRILGDHVMTRDDILGCVKQPDTIGRSNSFIDVHNTDGEGTFHEYIPLNDWYDIPYRALNSRNVTNLLTAGRCMSCSHWALGSLREQPTCMVTGQGAGVAGALAATTGRSLRDLEIPALHDALMAQGVDLGPEFGQEFAPAPWFGRETGPKYGQPLPWLTAESLVTT